MSIQSNINQGISLMSLLASQTSMAAKRRATKEAEADIVKRKYEEEQETNRATAEYNIKHKQIKEYKRTKEGSPAGRQGVLEGHLLTRRIALEAGEYLYDRNPTPELAENIGKYKEEIEELSAKQEFNKKRRAQRAKKSQEEAEIAAQGALAAEQSRIAASRTITEGIYYSPASVEYIKERQGGTN